MGPAVSTFCFPTIVCPSQVLNPAGDVAKAVASQVAGSTLDAVGSGLTQASVWLVGHVLDLIQTTSAPRLGAKWFGSEMALMEQVALLIVLPVLMVATIGPVLRQDARRLLRVWGVGLPVAVFAGLAGSELAGRALKATDFLCTLVVGPHSQQLAQQFTQDAARSGLSSAPLFVQIMLASLTLSGAVLVWMELMLRSAGVYVATFFMPLALVTFIWPSTAGIAKRAVEILAALILSKFVILASMSLGLAALTGGGVDADLSGAAVLLMAAFSPFALLRLAPVVETSVIAHLEGMSRRPGRAAARAATVAANAPVHPITQLVMSTAAARGAQSAASGNGGLPTRPVARQHVPAVPADYHPSKPSQPGSTDG